MQEIHLYFLKIEIVFQLRELFKLPWPGCGACPSFCVTAVGGPLWREGGGLCSAAVPPAFRQDFKKKTKRGKKLRFFGGTCEPFPAQTKWVLKGSAAPTPLCLRAAAILSPPPGSRLGAVRERPRPAPRPRPCGRRPVGGAAAAGGRRSPCEGSPCPGGEEEKGGPSRVTRWRRRCGSC